MVSIAPILHEYSTTSGQLVNASVISGPPPFAIAIDVVPLLSVAPAPGDQTALFYPAWATNWVLQAAPNRSSTNWVTITNNSATPVTCITVTNNPPTASGLSRHLLPPRAHPIKRPSDAFGVQPLGCPSALGQWCCHGGRA